ncbi:MAG: hypothetical protein HQL79_07095 [Magnetococcales bacterium]|nr:hypothetical protein [Magnetococcales bacterium]
MTDPTKGRQSIPGIRIVEQPMPPGAMPSAPPPSRHAGPDWNAEVAQVKRWADEGNWDETFKLLKTMSLRFKNTEIYKALAQRIWVALKTDIPVSEVVLALFHLLNTLGPQHEVAGPIAALAHFMAKHRSSNDPDRELAMGQAQQMFHRVCEEKGIVGEEAFQIWVKNSRLDDPNHYVPVVMHCLEIMVGDEWWFDRSLLQKELEQAAGHA